jgi:hypothetical protein
VAADAQDRVYVFQRKDPPVVVFDRDGKYLGAWGTGEVTDPHGPKIIGDTVYTTDRSDSVAKSFTLEGKVLLELGTRGQHSDTRNVTNWLADFSRGYPTPKGAKLPEVLNFETCWSGCRQLAPAARFCRITEYTSLLSGKSVEGRWDISIPTDRSCARILR